MSIEQHLAAIMDELLDQAIVHPRDHQKNVTVVATRRNGTISFAAEVQTEHECSTFSNVFVNSHNEAFFRIALAAVSAVNEPSLLSPPPPPKGDRPKHVVLQ